MERGARDHSAVRGEIRLERKVERGARGHSAVRGEIRLDRNEWREELEVTLL